MKRFVNLGDQLSLDPEINHFSFYCTVQDKYEQFNGNEIWTNIVDFEKDFLAEFEYDSRPHRAKTLDLTRNSNKVILEKFNRYKALIPQENQ